MARDTLTYASGNSASTTLSSGISNTDTSAPLTSDTNFAAKSGEGMVIIDEGAATEEFAYATTKSGSSLTIPLANRGLEGGSAQAHSAGATVKGIITATMWNDVIDSLTNVLLKTTGAVDTSKVLTPTLDHKRAYYVPAAGMFAATTSGAASGQYESTTNKNNFKVFDFDAASDEFVHFTLPSPLYWDAGTVTAKFFWTAASGSGNVIWGIQGVGTANDDTLDVAYGTAQTVTDTLLSANDQHVTSATSAMTIAGSPVAGEWLDFRLYRDANAGGDTLAVDARLLGVRIEFGVTKYSDE